MRRLLLLALAVLLVSGGFASSMAADGPTPVPFPTTPRGLEPPVTLPVALDATPGYVPQIACQPATLPGVAKLRELALRTYGVGGPGNTARKCNEGTSEHADGRAWDWMLSVGDSREKAAAGDFLAWLTANNGRYAKRLGIMYVIHNKLIWGVYRASDGWRPSYGHTDHIHISFSWNGARGNTSFWTGKIQPVDYGPCRKFVGTYAAIKNSPRLSPCSSAASLVKKTSRAQRVYGNTSSTNVAIAQGVLGVPKTSNFDATTWAAVKKYQLAHDIPYTGVLDQPTWGSLRPTDITTNVAAGYDRSSAADYGLQNYAGSPIRKYRAGKSVLFVQTALGMRGADRNGYFGAVTSAAVKAFQKTAGLEETGVVTRAEWQALAAL